MRKASIHFSAVLVFFAMTFFGCQNQGAPIATTTPNGTANSELSVVFIQSDSLQTGYEALAKELERLQENATKAEENINREANALQREVAQLQNKAQQGLLSPNQIQSEQQRIARKDQEILQKREVALTSIQQEQFTLQARFTEEVREILEALKEENGYDYILNQGGGSGVLVTNPAYDITELVLERLNAKGDSALGADSTDIN